MKILYISPRYDGGIGGHAKRVAEKLSEQGHDVKLKIVHFNEIESGFSVNGKN